MYLGSIGSWYLLEEMLAFFAFVRTNSPAARFLFISQMNPQTILLAAERQGIPKEALSVVAAEREEVPRLLATADFGLFFIKPCFSKQASSPTKLGEMLAMGLPVIANGGVGDLDDFFAEKSGGNAGEQLR